jgi:uncharacterized membrane protein
MEAGAIAFQWHWKGTKHMTPDSQTLFSITLFLALSSLLAWSNRRHRAQVATSIGVSLVCGNEQAKSL